MRLDMSTIPSDTYIWLDLKRLSAFFSILLLIGMPGAGLGAAAWAQSGRTKASPIVTPPKGDIQVVSFEINCKLQSTGKLSSMRIFFGIPKTIEGSQNVINLNFKPSPIAVYDDNDTRYAIFNFRDPPQSISLTLKGEIELHRRDLMTALSSWNAGGQSSISALSHAERAEYLKAEEFIEVNDSGIRAIANTIESPSARLAKISRSNGVEATQTAEIETVQEILQWLRRNIKYEMNDEVVGAAKTVKRGKGKCQEFSELFIALCRAKGLPARYVSGLNTYFDERNPNSTSRHGWAEVFVSGLDWVPFDPTWMASTSDIEKPIHICLTKMRHNLALGISSNFQWSYYKFQQTPVQVSKTDSYKFKALTP
jgi:hypothetical protein